MFDTGSIGKSFPPFTIAVERTKMHEFALAIGATNPIYHSRSEAQKAGYEDAQLLPTTPTQFEFWGNPDWMEHLQKIGLDTSHLLHVEQTFEYAREIRPGDALTAVTTVLDGKARQSMDMVTLETRYTNQHAEHVLTAQMKVMVNR